MSPGTCRVPADRSGDRRRRPGSWAAVLLLLQATACLNAGPPSDVSLDAPAAPAAAARGQGASGAYYRTDPHCVLVQPAAAAPLPPAQRQLEAALARQLSARFPRVLGAADQRGLSRTLALDPRDGRDLRRLARHTACPAILYWNLLADDHQKTPLWSRRALEIDASLRRSRDDVELWRGRHAVQRASGDPPLSLFSLPLAAYKAARFDRSRDLAASMADDLARGLFATLPDLDGEGRPAARRP